MSGPFGGPYYYGGSGISSNSPDQPPIITSGTVTCAGQITATFTWNADGDPINNLPPKSVIVYEYSEAAFSGDSGSASNGLGDQTVNGVSVGSQITVKLNPGSSFDVYCSPAANAEADFSPFLITGAGASVEYRAMATPVFITVAGALYVGPGYEPMMGQAVTASVVAGNYDLENYVWSFSTPSDEPDYFHHIEYGTARTNPDGDAYYDYRRIKNQTPAQYTAAQFVICWGEEGSEVLKATAVVVHPDLVGSGTVTAERNIEVLRPYSTHAVDEGSTIYSGILPVYVETQGAPTYNYGIEFTGKISTPVDQRTPSDDGVGSWGQLVTLDWRQWYLLVDTATISTSDRVLDNSFPYSLPKPPFIANYNFSTGVGLYGEELDSPKWGLKLVSKNYSIDSDFYMTLMYKPPLQPGGVDTYWVSLNTVHWRWEVNGYWSFGWQGPIGPDLTISSHGRADTRELQWEDVFINH